MAFRRLSTAIAVAVLASACGGIIDPSKNTVEPFTGTLQVGGTNTHNYSQDRNGEVEVTVTSVTPSPVNGTIGLALGQVLSGSCNPLAGYVATGVVNRKVQFGILNKGSYCLVVFDPSVLTVAVAYAVNVSHP